MKKTIVILLISLVTLWLIWQIDVKVWRFVGIILLAIMLTIGELFYDIGSNISYINDVYTLYVVMAFLALGIIVLTIILNHILKRKNLLLLCFGVTLFCAIFVRVVPDYSNDFGIRVTSVFDYYKYNKGYCLKEDRILSKEERFKRGINQYIDKEFQADKMIGEYRCKKITVGFCGYLGFDPDNPKPGDLKAGYYKLPGLKFDDPFGDIKKRYKKINSYKKIFFNAYGATLADPKDYLTINTKDMTGRFSVPFIRFTEGDFFDLNLNKGFVLFNNFSFYSYSHFISEYHTDIDYMKKNYSPLADHDPNSYAYSKIDNCGNVNFNVKKVYMEYRYPSGG